MDLVRFELTTSSMQFKKNQSLTDIVTENKRVRGRWFGRQWTPTEGIFTVWTPFGLQDSTSKFLKFACSYARGRPRI